MTYQPMAWYGSSYYYDEPDEVSPPEVVAAPTPAPAPAPWMAEPVKWKRGLVMGRFAPPHKGHQFVLNFARQRVEQLSIVMRVLPQDGVDPDLRMGWVQTMVPDATVLRIDSEGEHPNLADCVNTLGEILPGSVDVLFSSEPKHKKFASLLGAHFVCVDPDRTVFPISSSRVRHNPLLHWEFLPDCVRPHFVRTVRIIGAEGSGKTTLARRLAAAFQTCVVPEFAGQIARLKGKTLQPADFVEWAQAHCAARAALRGQAQRLLILDTDLQTVGLWFQRMFGQTPAWLGEMAAKLPCDHTILLRPITTGLNPEQLADRLAFHQTWQSLEPGQGSLSGTEDEVFSTALGVIEGKYGIRPSARG